MTLFVVTRIGLHRNREMTVPRYFFDVHDDASLRDDKGLVCTDMQAAFAAATRFAGALLKDIASDQLWQEGDWRISVRDEDDFQLFSVVVIGSLAPAGRVMLKKQTADDSINRAWAFPASATRP